MGLGRIAKQGFYFRRAEVARVDAYDCFVVVSSVADFLKTSPTPMDAAPTKGLGAELRDSRTATSV